VVGVGVGVGAVVVVVVEVEVEVEVVVVVVVVVVVEVEVGVGGVVGGVFAVAFVVVLKGFFNDSSNKTNWLGILAFANVVAVVFANGFTSMVAFSFVVGVHSTVGAAY